LFDEFLKADKAAQVERAAVAQVEVLNI